jgi:hypothetical protein
MSGDEIMALLVSGIVGIGGWKGWLGGLLFLEPLSRRPATQFLGWLLPPLAGVAMFFVLAKWSSHDVRDNPTYIFFYMVMWLGWTGLWNWLLPYFGLICRDDALERDNTAAGLAIAGGNIGDGPGWWVVVFCAGIATATLLLLWLIENQITRIQETITIDRDVAAGWRTGGFFIAAGLILGRAVAGDWHSTQETVSDFAIRGWPVMILWFVVVALDIAARPTPQRPAANRVIFGVLPGVLLVVAAIGYVIMQGPW